jgi:hypothetical protein
LLAGLGLAVVGLGGAWWWAASTLPGRAARSQVPGASRPPPGVPDSSVKVSLRDAQRVDLAELMPIMRAKAREADGTAELFQIVLYETVDGAIDLRASGHMAVPKVNAIYHASAWPTKVHVTVYPDGWVCAFRETGASAVRPEQWPATSREPRCGLAQLWAQQRAAGRTIAPGNLRYGGEGTIGQWVMLSSEGLPWRVDGQTCATSQY